MRLKRHLYWILIVITLLHFPVEAMTFNLFSTNNGVGLEAHRKLMRKTLESLGHIVYDREYDDSPSYLTYFQKADVNIFMEVICPKWFPCARSNWLIPNPECYLQDLELLLQIDLVLCFTHEVERIFQELGNTTYYSGFTSFDCFQNEIEKNFSHCLHVAGKSNHKGTRAIIDAWDSDSTLPQLTLIRHCAESPSDIGKIKWILKRIPRDQLRTLQNHCGIHLCPSDTEGFGHYIMEAMSAGAVVITTDAPPMNEFITDKRCLVPYQKTADWYLATRYFIAPEDLAKTIHHLQTLPESELKKIGEQNRARYKQKTEQFQINLKKLLDQLEKNI